MGAIGLVLEPVVVLGFEIRGIVTTDIGKE